MDGSEEPTSISNGEKGTMQTPDVEGKSNKLTEDSTQDTPSAETTAEANESVVSQNEGDEVPSDKSPDDSQKLTDMPSPGSVRVATPVEDSTDKVVEDNVEGNTTAPETETVAESAPTDPEPESAPAAPETESASVEPEATRTDSPKESVGADKAAPTAEAADATEKTGEDSASDNTTGLVLSDPRTVDDKVDSPSVKENDVAHQKEKSPATDDTSPVEEVTKQAVDVPGSDAPVNVTSNGTKTSTTKQPHPCLVCKKVIKCKYNIVGNGDIRHLCDDLCFKSFRATPTQFLRTEGQTKNANKPEDSNSGSWTPKMQLCTFCSKSFKTDQSSKFELRGGEIKPFCGSDCLKDFKAGKKVCGFCKSNVKGKKESLMASIYDGNGMAEFCNKDCHLKFVRKFTPEEEVVEPPKVPSPTPDVEIVEESRPRPKKANPTPPTPSSNASTTARKTQPAPAKPATVNSSREQLSPCSVCGQSAKVKHEIAFEGKTHKLCSDACFGAFRYANKLAANECCYCGSPCFSEGSNPHTIQFEGHAKKFCSITCVNAFKVGKTKIVPCTWCSAKKLNFDMIERVDANNTYQLFCSLNCLSLYRVNLQATSNQSVPCDQCRKLAPAQYHLTMSDASVRNFCDYACVMAFQGQFAKPQNQNPSQVRNEGTRGPTPMAQSKNTAAVTVNNTPTRQSSRQTTRKVSAQDGGNLPMISNVMSLAGSAPAAPSPAGRGKGTANNVSNVGVGGQTANVGSQIIIQPPPPKAVRNKALQCKPFTQTKATTCRPHTTTQETQTDESSFEKKDQVIFPIPVPIYVPMPMAMYNAPQPYPVPIPIPIPVPFFIPTTKKSADSILRHIKEIQERMPADPFEAELLMMAEAVATAEKSDSSDDSDNDDRLPSEPNLVSTLPALSSTSEVGTGDMGEDMLSMALRMAEMREENALDLEDSITATAVAPQPPPTHDSSADTEFSTIDQDNDILSASRGTRSGWRGGKRRRGRGSTTSTPRAKRSRVEETPPEPEPPAPPPPSVPQPVLSDANMVLKYSFGVNAWKHWVLQKNEQLEKASSTRSGKLKLFKTDILQCTSDELNYSLCLFVKEVRKPNGDEYAPDSIYYLCLGIQQYLFENNRIDNIFTDFYCEKFTECLNGILQRYEVRLNTQGLIVCRIEEEHLWESKQLGAHSPHVLLNTLIYFNTRYFMLRTAEDHVRLSFSHIMKHWKKTNIPGTRTPGRSVYLRYYAPVNAKDNANKNKKREEVPVYEQGENVDNPLRCPVKLYEFYLSKCPESIRNRNDVFYLVPERSCVPDSPVWYSTASLGVEPMSKMLNRVRVVREIQERHLHHQPYVS